MIWMKNANFIWNWSARNTRRSDKTIFLDSVDDTEFEKNVFKNKAL